ncbi:MAG: hypothetical protein ACOX19_12920 [Fermentimonas sp.]
MGFVSPSTEFVQLHFHVYSVSHLLQIHGSVFILCSHLFRVIEEHTTGLTPCHTLWSPKAIAWLFCDLSVSITSFFVVTHLQ